MIKSIKQHKQKQARGNMGGAGRSAERPHYGGHPQDRGANGP